jgi:hypothetical protein
MYEIEVRNKKRPWLFTSRPPRHRLIVRVGQNDRRTDQECGSRQTGDARRVIVKG